MATGFGMVQASTYKWLRKIFPNNTGPVGGSVGAIGALGGFIISTILGGLGVEAKSVLLFTCISSCMIILSIVLR